MSENERFVRGNEWLTRAMSDPDTRERVETIEGEMEQVERTPRCRTRSGASSSAACAATGPPPTRWPSS